MVPGPDAFTRMHACKGSTARRSQQRTQASNVIPGHTRRSVKHIVRQLLYQVLSRGAAGEAEARARWMLGAQSSPIATCMRPQ